MQKKNTRRVLIKHLVAAGFSLYLPACQFNKTKKAPTTTLDQLPIDTRDALEKAMDSNHVIYLQKKDADYDQKRQGFNLNIQKYPKLIALCKNTTGVAEAIQLAQAKKWKIAVKSGGHSFEGFSSIDDGLQINLSLMNKIQWTDNQSVIMEPACLLKDIYNVLLPKKRVIPAGSCGTVGVAGLTLGGGYGFFSRQYGLTCDSLLEATLVDGKGQIHYTKTGEELMWALKGGGNGNFGIVTQFKFQTHEAPDGFTRYRFKAFRLNKARTKSLLQKYFELSAQLPNSCFAAFVLNYRTLTLLITNYGAPNQALDNMIAAFKKLADRSDIGKKRDLAKSLKSYYGRPNPLYFKNASAGYYQNYDTIKDSLDDVLEVVLKTRGLIYQINTLGGNINNSSFAANSCYPHRQLPYLSELQAYWTNEKSGNKLTTAFNQIQDLLYQNGIQRQYRNYPHLGFKNWETAYFGKENYAKLQRIKRQYDPDDLFSNEQTIKP